MECWDVYDEDKTLVGKVVDRGERLEAGEYHLVVGIWTITPDGRVLLTQRHPKKDAGLMWECSGGGVRAGESSIEGARRELEEETGICIGTDELQYLGTIRTKRFFVDSYMYMGDISLEGLILQEEEVVDARLVTLAELDQMDQAGIIEEGMLQEFRLYQEKLFRHMLSENAEIGGIKG